MSRQLKFRIWSYRNSAFIESPKYHRLAIACEGGIYSGLYDSVLTDGDYVIQQWTGLVDSKKKDIYEGDILNIPDRDTFYKVVYYEYIASFQFLPVDYDVDVMTFRMCTNYNNFIANMRMTETYSIVGNIFQNQELLVN